MQKRVTIKDIAKKAGVSAGTVDRVIHERGYVAEDVKQRIKEVMQELGYERNLMASVLAFNRTFKIVVLLPDADMDKYWGEPLKGILKAAKAIQHYGFEVQVIQFELFSPTDFLQKGEKVIQSEPDGIIFPPIFEKEGEFFAQNCKNHRIPVVTFNSSLTNASAVLSYIGQNSFQSGLLAGRLLNFGLHNHDTVMIVNLDKEIQSAIHLNEKVLGCKHYFENQSKRKIEVVVYDFEDFEQPNKMKHFIYEVFDRHPNLAGIFVTNSRSHKLINAMDDVQLQQVKIVGFDLLPQNIELLNAGEIKFLINQNSVEQGYQSIITLFKYIFLKEKPAQNKFLPLDIVVTENVNYYIEKQESLQIVV